MNKLLQFELVWIMITIVLCSLLMLPVYTNLGLAYPFYKSNIICIVIATTFIRYIFLLKHHYLILAKWIKWLFIFIPIPVFLFLIDVVTEFQGFYDEEGIYSIMHSVAQKTKKGLASYIKNQMMFFWAAAFISNAVMPIRMVISLWREINKGTH